jgi:hypothetical protein
MNDEVVMVVLDSEQAAVDDEKVNPIEAGRFTRNPAKTIV